MNTDPQYELFKKNKLQRIESLKKEAATLIIKANEQLPILKKENPNEAKKYASEVIFEVVKILTDIKYMAAQPYHKFKSGIAVVNEC